MTAQKNIGATFGRWTVLGNGTRRGYAQCRCACGTERETQWGHLLGGHSRSCGCAKKNNLRHGCTGSGTYKSWQHMKERCRYDRRGSRYCARWEKFENFLADMGERPRGKWLDRIDVNAGYEPGNCRWVDPKTRARHTRRALLITVTLPLKEWCELKGIKYNTAYMRMRRGLPLFDEAP